jgi:7,8-dihydroneopterin aldolase/epimerase/oxygenase
MDRLILTGMVFFGRHGALAAERELGRRFTVDVELEADLRAASESDRLEDTINYVEAYAIAREEVEGEPRNLLETLAQRIAVRLLRLPRVERATVRVHKQPPVEGEFLDFAAEVTERRR